MIPEAQAVIIHRLLQENFLNEERFSKSFARGKFRIKKWGKVRIIRELKFREISKYNIDTALKEINEEDYLRTLDELAHKKMELLHNKKTFKNRKKITDHLLYKGFETQLVYEKVREIFG